MKNTYTNPSIKIDLFDMENIATQASGIEQGLDAEQIMKNGDMKGVDAKTTEWSSMKISF